MHEHCHCAFWYAEPRAAKTVRRRSALLTFSWISLSFVLGQRSAWAQVPRRSQLLAAAVGLGLSSPAAAQPSRSDVGVLQGAMLAVERMGDYPSKASLQTAEERMSEALARWKAIESPAPAELAAIFRKRAFVRRKAGNLEAALKDLDEAASICRRSKNAEEVQYEELPKVLVARAQLHVEQRRWSQALQDFDEAAESLGEPLEDVELLSGRAYVRQKIGGEDQLSAAAADYAASADLLRRVGKRPLAEPQAEYAAIALLGAGKARLDDAEKGLCEVIQNSVGQMSKDVAVLQRVVIADTDARMAMAAIAWHKGNAEIAETYWRDGCERIDILATEARGPKLGIGYPDGDIYDCDRYRDNPTWIREVRDWPAEVVAWFQDFLKNRPGTAPRDSYVQDLMTGRRPGDGSTLVDVALATDLFRRSDPMRDIQTNLQRSSR